MMMFPFSVIFQPHFNSFYWPLPDPIFKQFCNHFEGNIETKTAKEKTE
jgi:hypothetical protein